ncbi:S-layer homology domain-containing protein [Paenibacillus sp. UNCCL117]|uniref:S-layer homology domain-containing protein n=1 Tax=unclassified Paenibacillus TaxID=185978 RepID=UPI00088F74F1|nr:MULTISPECIES: S-layer homology domain-containing protein [unclassified Paenibacillus]SDE55980.1 S-layer homology domain-containing protein [Paenibacillus sp. cl123]SFW66300.1 S-layer homology domain-containing protein [Paenibacillus sp. UNCCL117]
MKASFIRLISMMMVVLLAVTGLDGAGFGTGGLTQRALAAGEDSTVTTATYSKVVHMTWDGFYDELYELAKQRGKQTPHLDQLVADGMRLTKHKTTIPSAVAARFATMTGAFPKTTGNTYKYLDGATVQNFSATFNQAQTLTQAMQGIRSATAVNETALKEESAPGYRYYATTSAALVPFADSVTKATYDIEHYGQSDYINLYANDLYMQDREVTSEQDEFEERLLTKLEELDGQLGGLMRKIREEGDPANTTYVLSSYSGTVQTKGKKTTALLNAIGAAGYTKLEVSTGAVAGNPDVATIKNYEASYLQLFIYNKASMTQDRVDALIQLIRQQDYVQDVLTRQQLDALGVHPQFADFLVIPKEGFTFCPAGEKVHRPDSYLPASTYMFGVVSGPRVAAKGSVKTQTSVTDLAPTIAELLAIRAPLQAEGKSVLNASLEEPLDNYVLYVNLDGFAYKWYELANKPAYGGTPVLNALIANGVHFTNARTGLPSITDAMQQAVVAGAWPVDTGNDYRHYDSAANVVVQYGRDNALENIAEAVVRHKIPMAAVNAFYFENRGASAGDATRPYITASGINSVKERADQMVKVILGEPFQSGGKTLQLEEVPHFLAFYADDIDAVGHNTHTEAGGAYGTPVALNVDDYYDNVARTVIRVDEQLGRIVQALKDRGIYDKTTVVLTTDHGMVQFGADNNRFEEPYLPGTYTSLADLERMIADVGVKFRGEPYKVETVFAAGTSAKAETEIVITTVGLQAQIKFRIPVERAVQDEIVERFRAKVYYGHHLYQEDIVKRGTPAHFADLVLSPKPPYHFKTGDPNVTRQRYINGQHDSLDDGAQRIFTLLSGAYIKKMTYDKPVYNIDMAQAIGRLLGIEGPAGATGSVPEEVLEEAYRGPGLTLTSPASDDTDAAAGSVLIEGSTAPFAAIKLNKKTVGAADGQGGFAVTHPLSPGINRIIAEAESGGRETRQVLFVTYQVPREQLLQLLAAAKKAYESAVEGPEAGQYKPNAKAAFKPALTRAVILSEHIGATQAQLDEGLNQLNEAYAAFRAAERQPAANYHIFGEIALGQSAKTAASVKLSTANGTVLYEAAYGGAPGETAVGRYALTDATDQFGNVVEGQLHYYFDMPAGEYTLTFSFGGTTATRRVTTVSTARGELPWGVYWLQRIAETSASTGTGAGSGGSGSGGSGSDGSSGGSGGGPSGPGAPVPGNAAEGVRPGTEKQADVQLDEAKLRQELQQLHAAGLKLLDVKVPDSGAGASVRFPAAAWAEAGSEMTLQVQTDVAAYRLPMQHVDVKDIAKRLAAEEADLTIRVNIRKLGGSEAQPYLKQVQAAGASPLSDPLEFSVAVEAADGRSVKVDSFGAYADRMLTVAGYLDPSRTSVIWFDPAAGGYAFVPAVFVSRDGQTVITAKRQGNSVYMAVTARKTFADIAGHWAEADVELLASKLLVNGASATEFVPDSSITRAEFASLLARGLGLGESAQSLAFDDVASADWFAGSVGAAVAAGLVQGDAEGSFHPNAAITREEMAVMLVRAMSAAGKANRAAATGEAETETKVEAEAALGAYSDQAAISSWAREAVAQVSQAGIVRGVADGRFAPAEPASRAQAAVMLKRLLQAVQFING